MPTLAERLAQAEAALHAVMLGKAPTEVRDADGTFIRYSRADPGPLQQYIDRLKAEIAASLGQAVSGGPMRVFFA
jgi:hypothetical protein